MNSPIVTSSSQQSSATTAYTILYSIKEGSIPFGPVHSSPSSWKKFLHKSVPHLGSESVITVVITSTESNTTDGPTVPKPQTLPENYEARIESFLHFLDSLGSETETTNNVMAEQ